MIANRIFSALVASSLICSVSQAQDFSYAAVAERYSDTRLDPQEVKAAKMNGECLVGLKQLIFVRRDHFDPVAEWINYRTISLLEQFPPCTVLVMMEVARDELMGDTEEEPQ